MDKQKLLKRSKVSVHEPEAQLLSAQDAVQDARRLRELLSCNRQQVRQGVQLQVPFATIIEAVDRLEDVQLRLLAQQLKKRLATTQS